MSSHINEEGLSLARTQVKTTASTVRHPMVTRNDEELEALRWSILKGSREYNTADEGGTRNTTRQRTSIIDQKKTHQEGNYQSVCSM